MLAYYDGIITINLTPIFGAGKEPTALQMDSLLSYFPNSWFNGTTDLLPLLNVVKQLNLKANTTQEAWITPTLLNGMNESSSAPRYRKNSINKVECKGLIGAVTASLTMFTFPIGYRPIATQYFTVISNLGNLVRIIVNTDGTVVCNATATWVSIVQVSFYVD
jgi:hypothetical protein